MAGGCRHRPDVHSRLPIIAEASVADGRRVQPLNQRYVFSGSSDAGPAYKLLASNKLSDEIFWSSAAITGDELLLRGQGHVFCIRE